MVMKVPSCKKGEFDDVTLGYSIIIIMIMIKTIIMIIINEN